MEAMIPKIAARKILRGRAKPRMTFAADHARSPQNGHQTSNRFSRNRQCLHAFRDLGSVKLVVLNLRSACAIIGLDMAKENSFDIVSKTDYAEVTNALNQTEKEISQRFDFKGSKASAELQQKDLMLAAEDETKLRNMNDILQSKLVKRGISLKALDYQKIEPAAGGTVRQLVKVQQGIPTDKAKEVVKFIKDGKYKVQASIQGETVRVSGKDRDTLQEVISALKGKDFGIDMQFDNYRSN